MTDREEVPPPRLHLEELRPIEEQRRAWSAYRNGLPFAGDLGVAPLSRHDVTPPLKGFPAHGEPWHYDAPPLEDVVGKITRQLADNRAKLIEEYLELAAQDPAGRGVLVTTWASDPLKMGLELSADVPAGELHRLELP